VRLPNNVEMSTALSKRPRVLAFVHRWSATRVTALELSTMRAELRGLGAEMTIYCEAGQWSLRTDDELEHVRDLDPSELVRIAGEHGVVPGADAVLVFDEERECRFRHVADGMLDISIGDALVEAGQALVATTTAPPRRAQPLTPPPEAATPLPAEYDIGLDINGKHTKRGAYPNIVAAIQAALEGSSR
jgi:hypothetical protein